MCSPRACSCEPHVTRLLSTRGLPGSGRLADREPWGTGPLYVFTLIASMCHMYPERCINNNPKQQEEDHTSYGELRGKWENCQQNSRTECSAFPGGSRPRRRRDPAGTRLSLRAARLPGAVSQGVAPRTGKGQTSESPPGGRQRGIRNRWGEGVL